MEMVQGKVKESMAEAGAKSADLWMVPVGEIHVIDGFNVRNTGPDLEAHITWIQGQVMERGFDRHKPLAGYVAAENGKNVIYIYDGHCRLEAVKRAIKTGVEIETLPVVISPKGTSVEDLVVALAVSAGGKPLAPLEKGLVCKKLIGFNWSAKEISKKLGITEGYVNELLDLVGAPAAVRNMVKDGKVSATTAMKAIKKHGNKAAETLQGATAAAAVRGKARATAKDLQGPKAAAGTLATAVLRFDGAFPNVTRSTQEEIDAWQEVLELAKTA